MSEFQLKVDKCLNHIQHGDVDLGYRLFIDCILDSKNLDFYKEAVALAEWQEKNESDVEGLSQRLKDCLNRLRGLEIHASSKSKLFEVKNLQKTYRRSNFSMKPVDLEVTTGEVWGLVGENGNGKTSLLRILAQDLKHNAGEIKYFGELENLRDYDLRTKLTYIPQRTPKWYGSLMSNLKFTASHYGIKGEENELLVNLTAFARDEDREKALQAGFNLHLAKPVEARSLVAVVAKLGKGVGAERVPQAGPDRS